MAKTKKAPVDPGVMLVSSYFALFAVNYLVLLVANLLAPDFVVLGTAHIPRAWALIHSMGTLALINTLSIPFINVAEKVRPQPFSPTDWMTFYFIINFVGLWVITRFSEQFGLGISAWYVAAALALVLDIVQGMAMMQLEKFRRG